jgi:beta-fructofuranosidase
MCKLCIVRARACATGPFPLDLGEVLYAPNCFLDGSGRCIMLAWMQEYGRRDIDYDYAGCLTLPRVLTLRGGSHVHGSTR